MKTLEEFQDIQKGVYDGANTVAPVEALRADVVFAPGGVDAVLEKISAEVRAHNTDISTKEGRAEIASLAYKVSRSKTALDDLGKNLVADWKSRAALVDADRRRVRERLDALRDEVRKPLTEWEDRERARVDGHEEALRVIESLATFDLDASSVEIAVRLARLNSVDFVGRDWQEFYKRANDAFSDAAANLEMARDQALKREAERARLEQLEREAAERAQRERDEKLKSEAAERARLLAEKKAQEDIERERAAAEAERKKIERAAAEAASRAEKERLAAEEKAKREAERARVAAEAERKKIERARVEAEVRAERAERDRMQAQKDAAAAAERAVAAERERAERARAVEEDAARKRASNEERRAEVETRAAEALASLFSSVTHELAHRIVVAVSSGDVPGVMMVY
jgi:hypothetical protein